jgi:aromatic ring-opening dioxygenase catalytic subunit (LigB family)
MTTRVSKSCKQSPLPIIKDAAQVLDTATEIAAASQPALFIPICPSAILIEGSEVRTFLREFRMKCNVDGRRPSCIICVSARWVSDAHSVKIMSYPRPQTVHHFFGFVERLYAVEYAAEGSAETAGLIAEVLIAAGIEWEFDD